MLLLFFLSPADWIDLVNSSMYSMRQQYYEWSLCCSTLLCWKKKCFMCLDLKLQWVKLYKSNWKWPWYCGAANNNIFGIAIGNTLKRFFILRQIRFNLAIYMWRFDVNFILCSPFSCIPFFHPLPSPMNGIKSINNALEFCLVAVYGKRKNNRFYLST